ncbi:MAG: NAD(P)-binding protein [Emcibacteraceae bacterium]|nr:NAD(P)-binding protein [Emcibacteraceae bacterium]
MTKKYLPNMSRRDFLGGVALTGAAGAMISPMELFAQQSSGSSNPYYPPSLTGMRGSHTGSFEVAHSVSWEGKDWGIPKDQTDEIYDLIVVGGGISGLSAAFLYQQKMGGGKKVLILDNHDDFGGHAKRNEFDVDGKLIIGYGGSQTIEGPGHYSPEAKQMLQDISIETERFYDYFDQNYFKKYDMSSSIFFQQSEYGKDRLVRNAFQGGSDPIGGVTEGFGKTERIAKIREFPISIEAQDSIIKLLFEAEDKFPTLSNEEKIIKLRSMSYMDYLQNYCDMPAEATELLRDGTKGGWGAGGDALSALECLRMWLPGMRVYGEVYDIIENDDGDEEPYIFHFPDGNAGVSRSLVRKLNPEAVPGSTMEDLVLSRVNYSLLDQENSPNRIRLNSTAVDVRHSVDQKQVDVIYVNQNKTYRVRGKHVILACYNNIIPYICSEVPQIQKEAIEYATKIPLVYTNVVLRNWRPFADLKTNRIHIPRGKMTQDYYLDFPVSMGDYRFSENPDQPIIVHGTYVPMEPDQGYSHKEQAIMGRQKVYQHTFDDFEQSTLAHFEGMLKGTGFDAERDIAAITVNRWPHGYAWEYNDLYDPPEYNPRNGPHIAGSAQIGRISIANSDASAYAYVNGAIDAAIRAVNEQVKL